MTLDAPASRGVGGAALLPALLATRRYMLLRGWGITPKDMPVRGGSSH